MLIVFTHSLQSGKQLGGHNNGMNDKEQTENKLLNESTLNSVTNSKCNGNFPILCKLWFELKNLFSSEESRITNHSEECNGHFSALCSLWKEIKNFFEQNQNNLTEK